MMDCVVGGRSVLDLPRLNIASQTEAIDFVRTYGYDLDAQADKDELWSIHARAVSLLRDHLLNENEEIPREVSDPGVMSDLTDLLLLASSFEPGAAHLRRWACAVLKVMHVHVHLKNDLFSAFRDEIQTQILGGFHSLIRGEEGTGFQAEDHVKGETVQLERFEVKPFKTTASAVIKLLARPDRVALNVLDKVGVRFVTSSVFDSFRLIRLLVNAHVVSFPHIIPDQSSNTLYPLNLLLEAMDELVHSQATRDSMSDNVVEQWLTKTLQSNEQRAEFKRRKNDFSGPDHRFIKFISRKLITVQLGTGSNQRPFRFFYPFEVQIMDRATFDAQAVGENSHEAYKARQRNKARERVLGLTNEVL